MDYGVIRLQTRNSGVMSEEIELLKLNLDKEIEARKQAEAWLEEISRDLYSANEELRNSTAALREQSERAAAIVDNAAEGIVTFDENLVIDSFNPAAEEIFGLSREAAMGKTFVSLFKAINAAEDSIDISGVKKTGELSYLGRRKDGTEFPVDVVTSCVRIRNKKINTAIIRDMTAHYDLERQLSHAQKMESIGQLAAGIAHEINTPIQYVGDNTRFLSEAFEDLEKLMEAYSGLQGAVKDIAEAQPYLEKVEAAAEEADLEFLIEEIPSAISQSIDGTERVKTIVRAMKDFAHPSQEEKIALDLNRAIESTTTVCRNEWKYVAEIELDLEEGLPMVEVYAGDFNQTVLNLIVNGAHAIQEKIGDHSTEKGKIRVCSKLEKDYVEIQVSDSGTGIPDEIRQKIFDPFFTTKGVGRGTGQGLSIAYHAIVEKHEGELKLESKVGEGTTFFIRLPLSGRSAN